MKNPLNTTKTCPKCENSLQMSEGFITWCENCDWNLSADAEKEPQNFIHKKLDSLGEKYGDSLFKSLIDSKPEELRPKFSFSIFLAFLISAFVHFATLIFAIIGLYLLISYWGYILLMVIGVIFILLAWLVRPRIPKIPLEVVPRSELPKLYELVDEIAQLLGTKPVDGIVINEDFNAAFGQFSWSNKKILFIGLPLWSILTSEEKIAVISHELSHGINSDPMRGFFIGSAIDSLLEWQSVLYADEIWERGTGLEGLLLAPFNIFLRGISFFVGLLAVFLLNLLYFNSQKAEYLADYLATNICGTKAMVNSLEKIQFGGSRFGHIVQFFSTRNLKSDLFAVFQKDILNLPPIEKERILRLSKLEKMRLDLSHPPTFFRKKFLENHFQDGNNISGLDEKISEIDSELEKLKPRLQEMAIDMHRVGI